MLSRVFYWGIVLQILLSRQMFATDSQPNIVIILADDMGSGDVHALNSASQIPTPHLDRLASEGMTFTDAHTPSAVCTPTRYGLLTGRYCWRTRLKSGVQDGYGPPLIDRERQTIAELPLIPIAMYEVEIIPYQVLWQMLEKQFFPSEAETISS